MMKEIIFFLTALLFSYSASAQSYAPAQSYASAQNKSFLARLDAMLFTCQMASKNNGYHSPKCEELSQDFTTEFKALGESRVSKMKPMFAQWLTAMRVAGTRTETTERDKFTTLMNQELLDY